MSDELKDGSERLDLMLSILERMAAGEVQLRVPLTGARDKLDALALGINSLAGEILYHAEAEAQAERAKAAALEQANLLAEEASQAKDRFIANVSHEIRTPLTAIMATVQVLGRGQPSADFLATRVERIRRNAHQLVRIIDDILDYSLIESGRFAVSPSKASPADIARGLSESYVDLARLKGLAFAVGIDSTVPRVVEMDPTRVRQVIDNLVSNALKFTAAGEVRVNLEWEGGEQHGTLRFLVKDTGIGIEPKVAERLFRPFEQAELKASKIRGTGLGLALSRKLARQMGGDVELLQSLPHQGSIFLARFPVQRPAS
jgi:signal transduction histidine kinase